MPNQDERPQTWWIFFPMRGIDIADDDHGLDSPVFDDATVISRRHVSQVAALYERVEVQRKPKDGTQAIEALLGNAGFREDFQSLVAVRRTGTTASTRAQGLYPHFIQAASARAHGIAAALSLCLLATQRTGATCGLLEQTQSVTTSLVSAVGLQDGGLFFGGRGASSFAASGARPAPKFTRQELLDLASRPLVSGLSSVLLPQSPPLPRSLRNAVTQAAVRLADAIHSPMAASQLIGAVTSMDILLARQREPWASLEKRIAALVGSVTAGEYDLAQVLRARHLYIHRGQPPRQPGLVECAAALALSCLLCYAEIARQFQSKEHLLCYLDFVSQATHLMQWWGDAEKRVFSGLLRHKWEHVTFAWASPMHEPEQLG